MRFIRKPYTGEEQTIGEFVRRFGVSESEARTYLKILPPEDDLGPLDYEFDKTIVFIAFAAEEVGLSGSRTYAAMAKQTDMQIEAVLNNDIIGSDVDGKGQSATHVLRVFAAGPDDSPTRELGRYMKQIAERFVPSMQVRMIFRADRFERGGDHIPFAIQCYAAVRLTTPNENYANQHSTTDTFANTSVPYTTRVVRMNVAVLASLALAPAPPF